ncbi:hypothetical protein D3C87_1860300 [compost metagenome]
MTDVSITNSELKGVIFTNHENWSFSKRGFHDVNIENCKFEKVVFTDCKLNDVLIKNVTIKDLKIRGLNLSDKNIDGNDAFMAAIQKYKVET